MRMEQLNYLCEVCKYRSLNAASEKMHIAQQTLSASIKSLETELNAKLFVRSHQGIFPTSVGLEVIEWAEGVLSSLEQMKLKIEAMDEREVCGSLTVGMDAGNCLLIMPKVTSILRKIYPKLQVETVDLNRVDTEYAVKKKQIDLGIVSYFGSQLPADAGPLQYRESFKYTFFASVSRESALADLHVISLSELIKHPLVLYDNGNSDFMDELQKYGELQAIKTTGFMMTSQMVCDNQAASLFVKINNYTNPIFNLFPDAIKTIPIAEEFSFNSCFVVHRDNEENRLIHKFIQVVAAAFLL